VHLVEIAQSKNSVSQLSLGRVIFDSASRGLKNSNYKFSMQVDRMIEKAQGSMTVQTGLVAELRKNTDNVQTEIANFKRAAEAWMARQIVKVWYTYTQRYRTGGNIFHICPLLTVCNLKLRVGSLFVTQFVH